MNANWQIAALGDVVRYRKEFIEINDLENYKRCRVKLHAQGVVLRDVARGAEIKTKKQQVCRMGEFLVAEIDAKAGGFGIVPSDLDGAIVSSHYFLFEVDESKLNRRFLDFYIRTRGFRDQVTAQGSTNYAAVRPNEVLGYRIPLPPLEEQHRIVARIEELTAKIEEARGLRREVVAEADHLTRRQLARIFNRLAGDYRQTDFNELVDDAGYGTSVRCDYERGQNAIPVLRIPNVASERMHFGDLKYGTIPESERVRTIVSSGDILIVRTNGSAELVGRCAVVPQTSEPTAFASYLIRLRPNKEIADSDYMQWALRHLRLDGQLFDLARTTAGQYNVSLGRLYAARIPLPPLREQHRIVAYLDGLQAKVDALKRLQAETAAELDALLPSVLDRTFRGEL